MLWCTAQFSVLKMKAKITQQPFLFTCLSRSIMPWFKLERIILKLLKLQKKYFTIHNSFEERIVITNFNTYIEKNQIIMMFISLSKNFIYKGSMKWKYGMITRLMQSNWLHLNHHKRVIGNINWIIFSIYKAITGLAKTTYNIIQMF